MLRQRELRSSTALLASHVAVRVHLRRGSVDPMTPMAGPDRCTYYVDLCQPHAHAVR